MLRLGALGERATRVAWLAHWIANTELPTVAAELEALLEAAESRVEAGTLGLISVVQWVSGAINPGRMHELATQAREQDCRLAYLLEHASSCPLEFKDEPRALPKQANERPLTLGERKNLARRAGRKGLARLLRDPHPAVLEQLILNPLLTEPDLVRLVTTRPPSISGLCALVREGRWLLAPRVRMGLLQNPELPLWQSTPLLWLCTRPELMQIANASSLPQPLQASASALSRRRAPFSLPPSAAPL